MKIVYINGSIKGTHLSYSRTITNYLIEELKKNLDEEILTDEIVARNLKIETCEGCRTCMRKGQCHFDDEFPALAEKLTAADVVIFGTGTYVANVSTDLKRLIERMYQMIHKRALTGKLGVLITTSFDAHMGEMNSYYIRNIMRHLGLAVVSEILYPVISWPRMTDEKLKGAVEKNAALLLESYRTHAFPYAEPEFGMSLEQIVKNNPQMASAISKFFKKDLQYWKDKI